jgi:G6PDH family F420-dependent oxidoreductase
MVRFGYALSSEEHSPRDLVRNARLAEEAGFEFALISDHFHPWIDAQGHSGFVWAVLGGIARETSRLEVGTGVTAPIIRIHPAIIAHAAATVADLFEGRFFLGIGTGENLNEHVLGDPWPPYEVRREMLVEAIDVMQGLWQGDLWSHRGEYYVVENARIYDPPKQPIRIMIAAGGPQSATLAGQLGDGLIVTSPQSEVLDEFRSSGGEGKPIYGQTTVCWARTEEEATRTLHRIWPNAGVPGDLSWELPLPQHFEQASQLVTEEMTRSSVVCGSDVDRHVAAFQPYVEAGFDEVYVANMGPHYREMMRAYGEKVLPALRS